MSIETKLESLLKKSSAAPSFARIIQIALAFPRYWYESFFARIKTVFYRHRYKNPLIVIFGLPKSGTTWLEKMLSCLPGYTSTVLPEMILKTHESGEGLNLDIPERVIRSNRRQLLIIKTHSHASDHNLELMRRYGVRYIMMYRDIRDVAVSYAKFVGSRPWHPEFRNYYEVSLDDALKRFLREIAPGYCNWILEWQNADLTLGYELTYEIMKSSPIETFIEICEHLEISVTNSQAKEIIDRLNNSQAYREVTHYREGISGRWKHYFSEEIKLLYRTKIGDELIAMGYESNNNW